LEYERLIEEAAVLLEKTEPVNSQIKIMNEKLVQALGPKDEFLFNWRYICKQKGWLK